MLNHGRLSFHEVLDLFKAIVQHVAPKFMNDIEFDREQAQEDGKPEQEQLDLQAECSEHDSIPLRAA
jgi:hypothetical protein